MAEMRWIRRKEDIVTLRTGRVGAFFEELVERLLGVIDRFLTKWCRCRIITVRCAMSDVVVYADSSGRSCSQRMSSEKRQQTST